MKMSTIPRAYLGTMTFGWSQTSSYVDEKVALDMVQKFIEFNDSIIGRVATSPSGDDDDDDDVQQYHLDTARVYAGGKTEQIVGTVLKKLLFDNNNDNDGTKPRRIVVGTKAAPSVKPGGLSTSGIEEQFQSSMDAMGISTCDEYYLHQPDTEHPLLESLKCADSLLKNGKIGTIGMSNYHACEVSRAFELCTEHNLSPPTVYQGLYNPLNRLVEDELLPLLKKNGCSFVAYNPLVSTRSTSFLPSIGFKGWDSLSEISPCP
jgi:aflatoxin B1 aldehyde reductase